MNTLWFTLSAKPPRAFNNTRVYIHICEIILPTFDSAKMSSILYMASKETSDDNLLSGR